MQVPFIQLFRTPNSTYLLDVNKNEFIQINEQSFQYLAHIMDKHDDKVNQEQMPQELIALKDSGYLSAESAVKEIRHYYTEYLGFFLDRKLSKITLQLTQNCNFRCTYCIYSEQHNLMQRSHSNIKMSWETAKQAIDFLWDHSVDSKRINIGLYGGEPLLEFPLIQRIVKYCVDRFSGKELTFNITTNGTLLRDEMIYFFQKYNVSVMISLDGPKEINDKNRVFKNGQGTYEQVIKRIKRVKEIAPEFADKLQVSMVIDPQNDFDCINSITLEGSDLDKVMINPSMVEFGYEDRSISISEEYSYKSEYQRFLSTLAHYNRYSSDDVSPIANSSTTRIFDECSKVDSSPALSTIDVPSGPCIPGPLRLFVNAFGQLFPCERVSESSASMMIGTLDQGFNMHNASQLLNVGKIAGEYCINCWCFRYCTLCAKGADDGSAQLSTERKLSACAQIQANANYKFKFYLLTKEIPVYYQNQTRSLN
jgi:uncharacterized protein